MFRFFNEVKPGRRKPQEDLSSLVLVQRALQKAEREFLTDEDSKLGVKYFDHAEDLYNHWSTKTGREKPQFAEKIEHLYLRYIQQIRP